jgi:hypothetical protein
MGDASIVEFIGKGRVEIKNRSFENVLHVPKLFVNLLSMYQMNNSITGNKLIFEPDVVDIYDMKINSKVSIGEVNHQSKLYIFSKFIEPDFGLLLTHDDEISRIWNERLENLNLRYMKNLIKKGIF